MLFYQLNTRVEVSRVGLESARVTQWEASIPARAVIAGAKLARDERPARRAPSQQPEQDRGLLGSQGASEHLPSSQRERVGQE